MGHGRKEVERGAELAAHRLTGAQHCRGSEKPWTCLVGWIGGWGAGAFTCHLRPCGLQTTFGSLGLSVRLWLQKKP